MMIYRPDYNCVLSRVNKEIENCELNKHFKGYEYLFKVFDLKNYFCIKPEEMKKM